MTTSTLKQSLGEGLAHIDDSHGDDNLYDVLKTLAVNPPRELSGEQSTPATATLESYTAAKATKLQSLSLTMGTSGTSGAATVTLDVATVTVATVTVDNTDADGTTNAASIQAPIDIPAGSLVELIVTAIPGSGADLVASALISGVTVE
jgi:hypothetical protein